MKSIKNLSKNWYPILIELLKSHVFICKYPQYSVWLATVLLFIISGCHFFESKETINKAHKEWDKLNLQNQRATWFWSVTPQYWEVADSLNPLHDEQGSERFWNNHRGIQDLVLDFCINKSINTIYFYNALWCQSEQLQKGELENQEQLAAFIRKANQKDIKIWGLFYLFNKPDSMGNVAQKEHILAAHTIADAYGRYNKKNPDAGFYGIQCDQEPNTTELFVPLIEFCETVTNRVNQWNDTLSTIGAHPFVFSQTYKPSYVTQKVIEYKGVTDTVARHLLAVSHHASFMDYVDIPETFLERGETLLRWADEIPGNQKVVIGIETNNLKSMWPGSAGETYYEEIAVEDDTTRFNRFEQDMRNAEKRFINSPSYERIAIHSIHGYFQHWFGQSFTEVAEEI